jgi:hypothetical protein
MVNRSGNISICGLILALTCSVLWPSHNVWAMGTEEGLIGYWPFDECQGTVAFDQSGNHNDMHFKGAAWSYGKMGPGAIDTHGGYALAAHSSDLELNGSYTIAAWVRNDESDLMINFVCKHWATVDDDGSWEVYYCNTNTPEEYLNFGFREFVHGYGNGSWYYLLGADIAGGSSDPDWGFIGAPQPVFLNDVWTHVALTYDDTNMVASLYVNGVLRRCGPWISEIGGSVAPLVVGTDHLLPSGDLYGSNHFFPGHVDELRIYNRALSTDDISNLIETIDVEPNALNLKSKGRWITVYLEPAEGVDVYEIDASSLWLNGLVPAESDPTGIQDHDFDGILDLMVKYDRQLVQAILEPGEAVEIVVTGSFTDGTLFRGVDFIKVF